MVGGWKSHVSAFQIRIPRKYCISFLFSLFFTRSSHPYRYLDVTVGAVVNVLSLLSFLLLTSILFLPSYPRWVLFV